jgi:hypothetical protein
MENVLSNICMFLPQHLRLPSGIRDMNVYVILIGYYLRVGLANLTQDFSSYEHSCFDYLSSASSCQHSRTI